MNSTIIIGTRGSDLALWQAHHVKAQLETLGQECRIHIIKTRGDQIQHLGFDKMEGKGFFTKEIEESLLQKEIDIAVHSHKDLETEQPEKLCIAAVSPRADPRELLLIRPEAFDDKEALSLKKNAVLGTSSARRKSQALYLRSDIQLADIRGNVPTRIQKLRDGNFDAILLAKAGVDRLNLDLSGLVSIPLDTTEFVPAPAQGVLAIQCRKEDFSTIALLSKISDADVQKLIHIERTVLNKMQGGCQLPLGIYATKKGEQIRVDVAIADSWNSPLRKFQITGSDNLLLIEQILQTIHG